MPPAWWGLRYERDAPNACPLNSLALRKPRATSEAAPGAFDPGATQPSPDALPLELQPGPGPRAAGAVEAIRAASSRNRAPTGQAWLSFSPRRAPAERARLQVNARIAPARLDLPSPQPAATPWSDLGSQTWGFAVEMDLEDAVSASLPRQCPGCISGVTGSCRRTADSTSDPPRGRTRRPPGGPGNPADRPRSASCGRGVSVPGVARPRPTAAPPHLARRLKGLPARAARRSQRPPGTSTCKRNLWER